MAGAARLDQLTDIMQLGMLALALVLGRPIRGEEFPQKVQDVLNEASTPGALGPRPAIARPLHGWILRAMQPESRAAFRSMHDAAAALEALVASEPRHKASAASVVAWVATCQAGGVAVRAPSGEPAASPRPDAEATSRRPAPAPPRQADTATNAREYDPSVTVRLRRTTGTTIRRISRPEAVAATARPSGSQASPQRNGADVALQETSALDWASVRRGVRVAVVAAGLVGLFGATYLGARGYLGLPGFIGRSGTLVVESLPAGAEVFVDGLPQGRTPATLELKAGEHTLALRAGDRTTLVPVVVVSGARRVERVEIPRRRQAGPRPAKAGSASKSAKPGPASPARPTRQP